MRNKVITIREVAKQAGVSVGTVSNVLNGKYDGVNSDKRDRVLEVVRELGYRPNAIARSMVTRSTATIGLIISELKNPLFVPVVEGVQEVLSSEGYHIVLAEASDMESEAKAIETLRRQQVDGFIFMSLSYRYPSEHLNSLKEEEFPFVVINRDLSDPGINLVQLDDLGAGYTATKHLLELGHTRIAAINGPIYNNLPRRSAIERHNGWHKALQEKGLETPPEWNIVGEYSLKDGYNAAQQLITLLKNSSQPPTALFVADDTMAVGALRAFIKAGVRVPEDLALVTIGDPPIAAYTVPALTTLSLPVVAAGKVAARILLTWIKAETPPRPQKVWLSFSLHIRESCGTPLNYQL